MIDGLVKISDSHHCLHGKLDHQLLIAKVIMPTSRIVIFSTKSFKDRVKPIGYMQTHILPVTSQDWDWTFRCICLKKLKEVKCNVIPIYFYHIIH